MYIVDVDLYVDLLTVVFGFIWLQAMPMTKNSMSVEAFYCSYVYGDNKN